jgi:hypothetical protein
MPDNFEFPLLVMCAGSRQLTNNGASFYIQTINQQAFLSLHFASNPIIQNPRSGNDRSVAHP